MQPAQYQVVADIDQSHWWFTGRRAILRDLLDVYLPRSLETTVVDVGCGPGANIAALTDRYHCVGIDNATEAIDAARQRFPDVRFIHGDAPEDLGELADAVDAYLLMDVLEHVEDDRALLSSLVETLRPGGLVFITVPADMRLWSEQDVQLGHHRRYDVESLRRMWQGLPLSEEMVSPLNSRLYGPVLLVRTASRLSGRSWGEAGSDMRQPRDPGNSVLTRLFTGESRRLVGVAEGQRRRPYRRGVSLVTVLRRVEPNSGGSGAD